MSARRTGFTLLELLASVTILVIMGTMLFQVFGKSTQVMSISNARQEVFQYARAALEFFQREISGGFTGADAVIDPAANTGIKGLRVYSSDNMGVPRRSDCQGIFLSTAIQARDTRATVNGSTNPYFGFDINVARVAYYLTDNATSSTHAYYQHLERSSLCRAEMYDLTQAVTDPGGPFIRNCLYFNLLVCDYANALVFQPLDWNSDVPQPMPPDPNSGNKVYTRRRGLPLAVFIRFRITDEVHAKRYTWGPDPAAKGGNIPNIWFVPGVDTKKDYWGEEDPVVQTFSEVVYFGRRSD